MDAQDTLVLFHVLDLKDYVSKMDHMACTLQIVSIHIQVAFL